MPRKNCLSLPLIFILLLLTACGLDGPPRIEAGGATVLEAKLVPRATGGCGFCEAPSTNLNSQAALTIRNRGGETDTLLKVETERAGQVALRKTDSPGDLSGSILIDSVQVPPYSSVVFGQDQYAMVLLGLRGNLVAGQTLRLTLYFEKSDPVDVDAVIIPRN